MRLPGNDVGTEFDNASWKSQADTSPLLDDILSGARDQERESKPGNVIAPDVARVPRGQMGYGEFGGQGAAHVIDRAGGEIVMMEQGMLSGDNREILTNAAEWRLIALLLERPRQHTLPQMGCFMNEVGDPYLKEIAELACNASDEVYLPVFGPGGLLPAREVDCVATLDRGRLLSQIGLLYETCSFAPRSDDPYDHIAVEADFISYLYKKEVQALLNDDERKGKAFSAIRQQFIREHFAPFLRELRKKLRGNEPVYLLKALIAILTRLAANSPTVLAVHPSTYGPDPSPDCVL
jgi:nitrate reductase assembly molybdenum cofactor insertion protein NarJ